jgi:hypothetical protein
MSVLQYLSSSILKKFKKNSVANTENLLGGAQSEAEQNEVASFYHS